MTDPIAAPRRMKRRLFNLAAAVSLVMMLATVALWVRSYYCWDTIFLQRDVYSLDARAANGKVGVDVAQRHVVPPWRVKMFRTFPRHADAFYSGLPTGWSTLGFSIALLADPDLVRAGSITLPIWFLSAAASLLPAHWLLRRLACDDVSGKCVTCGYDLRATPDRCPECGMAVAPKPAEAAA